MSSGLALLAIKRFLTQELAVLEYALVFHFPFYLVADLCRV